MACVFAAGCGNDAGQIQEKVSLTDASSSETELISMSSEVDEAVAETIVWEDESILTEEESLEDLVYSPPTVSLVMVGDILLHTPLAESGLREDGSYDFTAVFANTKDVIQEADLALVNQEVIIGGVELGVSGYPAFNAPYELGDALVDAGFDVVCHATNHTLDKGKKGAVRCLEFWKLNYPEVAVLGINETAEEQDEIYIYEQDDIRIAILNYTYGTNGIPLPEDMPYVVNLLEEERVVADLQRAEELADFTIVCPHWGTEYLLGTDSWQQKWTEIFLKNGVDLVLGTHPHVIEPVEWVYDETTGKEMLVYYSLGNFVNWTSGRGAGVANRMVGGMAEITLEKLEDGTVSVADYGVTALVCHVTDGQDGVTVYPLADYTDELGQQNQIVDQDGNFSREYCVGLCNEVWGELWE
ncbi:MAG: CapA family protein [Lachnospiraceae bacterium]|nr:CapA family protein [Lachnospiraceae bacterium]